MVSRGHYLETEIERVLRFLGNMGVHGHKNHAKRTAEGAYLEGEPFDYEVLSDGVLHCFDAKECSGDKWSLKNAKLSQVDNLLKCAAHGAKAFFLVYFKTFRKLIRFDAQFVKEALCSGKKSLGPDEGVSWDWTELRPSRKNTP